MFVPNIKITLKDWICQAPHEVTIESDINNLTDSCTLSFPKKIAWQGFAGEDTPLKRGDKILIDMGYDGDFIREFNGYIKTIGTKNPIKLVCEDEMWLLKQSPIKKEVYRQIKLKALIEKLIAQVSNANNAIVIQCPIDVNLGNYRITRNTIAEELEELKKVYGFYAYFRNINGVSKLYAGWGYPTEDRVTHRFEYARNIIDENNLEYIDAKDVKLKVEATSVLKNNKRIKVTVGDKDGERRSVYAYNMEKDDLTKFALAEMERFKYTGIRGSFTAFGYPSVKATDIVRLKTQNGTTGSYLIKKLTKTYGTNGYKQKIELGIKIA